MEQEKRKQPAWTQPTGGVDMGLRVANSLARDAGLVPFVPQAGRRVGWYICGPTTYDSSHLGHARNYVSFDVIRRILTDYFNYDVFSVMNITDVDDKIIIKARHAYLLQQYEQQNPIVTAHVVAEIREALEKEVASCGKKRTETLADMEKSEAERVGEARLLEQRALAASQFLGSLNESAVGQPSAALIRSASDALAVALDAKFKETVKDLDVRATAARYEKEFLDDMATLGVRMPDVLTRVTEYIPQVIAYVERIIANGYGYESNGSVYFDMTKYVSDGHHAPGKLAPSKVGNARAQEDADGSLSAATSKKEKRSEADFVLWKNSKAGEPTWQSPWGLGRPGWHIECSAMASELLGQTLDVHSGGQDLYFPHHENEIAQCEAYFHNQGCSQWVNYFLHSGHLHIDGLKMSKSLKNFITIRQALEPPHNYTPRQLRLFFITRAWNKEVNFDASAMQDVFVTERAFEAFFAAVASVVRQQGATVHLVHQAWSDADKQLNAHIHAANEAVHAGFCNNFDTKAVIKALEELATQCQKYLSANSASLKAFLLMRAGRLVTDTLNVVGLLPSADELGWNAGQAGGGDASDALVEAFYQFRQAVREVGKNNGNAASLLRLTDELRDNVLPPLGLKFDDSALGWKRVDAAAAMAERRAVWQADLARLENKLSAAVLDLTKAEKANAPPASVLDRAEFSAYDATGFPTALADGTALPSARSKKLRKEWDAQQKLQVKLHEKAKGNVDAYLVELHQRVDSLRAQTEEIKKHLQ